MTKLIDAYKLWGDVVQSRKESIITDDVTITIGELVRLIDNAPTVPLPDFKEGYKQAILDGKTNFSRPQGEWIEITEYDGLIHSKCNQCQKFSEWGVETNFCPNCGADMRKEAENE